MKNNIPEFVPANSGADPIAVSSRRDFTKRSVQALLTISLLDHLCTANLLAADAKLTAKKWLTEVNQIGLSLKGKKLKQVEWQAQIEDLLKNKIALPELQVDRL